MIDRPTIVTWIVIAILTVYLIWDDRKLKRQLAATKANVKPRRHAMREEWRGFGSDVEPR